ncbi:MAG: HU family DNA-binding protein [Phycisphaerales bacterium]
MKSGKTITKKELAENLAARCGLNQQAVKDLLQMTLDQIVLELGKGNRFEFREFGVLEPVWRRARGAHNPKTLAKLTVPARRVVKFKQGRLLKEAMLTKPETGPADDAGSASELKLTRAPRAVKPARAGRGTTPVSKLSVTHVKAP